MRFCAFILAKEKATHERPPLFEAVLAGTFKRVIIIASSITVYTSPLRVIFLAGFDTLKRKTRCMFDVCCGFGFATKILNSQHCRRSRLRFTQYRASLWAERQQANDYPGSQDSEGRRHLDSQVDDGGYKQGLAVKYEIGTRQGEKLYPDKRIEYGQASLLSWW